MWGTGNLIPGFFWRWDLDIHLCQIHNLTLLPGLSSQIESWYIVGTSTQVRWLYSQALVLLTEGIVTYHWDLHSGDISFLSYLGVVHKGHSDILLILTPRWCDSSAWAQPKGGMVTSLCTHHPGNVLLPGFCSQEAGWHISELST